MPILLGIHDASRVKECDKFVKNKWNFQWTEKKVPVQLKNENIDVSLGESIRKVDIPGKALCELCAEIINYGQKGYTALKGHIQTAKHRDKIELRRQNYVIAVTNKSSLISTYGLDQSSACTSREAETRPLVPFNDRKIAQEELVNFEAMVLATMAEYQLPFTMAPAIIDLAKALNKDSKALNSLSMARTTASYKMQHGLAKSLQNETVENMKNSKFSLNMDESTSNNLQRVLSVLVSYFKEDTVVVEHLVSLSVVKVDSQSLFNEIDNFFTEHEIPWENLVSILMDSCNVMRGSKTGLETRIRESRAGHLLDIDGDSCHHIHNASKYFCRHFEHHVEGLHTTIFNDFKWSSDLRDVMMEICLVLNIKFTMPDKMVPHRWLSCYDVTVSNKRMLNAFTVFYFSFLSVSQKVTYQGIINAIYAKREVSQQGQQRLRELQNTLSAKKMTDDGKKRKSSACSKLFKHRKYTRLVTNYYITVLPIFKRYVMLFELKEPSIHTLYEEQKKLMTEFLSCFMKVEFVVNKSGKELQEIDVSKNHVKPTDMFMGDSACKMVNSSKKDPAVKEFLLKVEKGYEECAAYLQKKLPLNSKLLRAVTSLDPVARQHSVCLSRMKQLPRLVTNVIDDEELDAYSLETHQYQVDKSLPSPVEEDGSPVRIDTWWAKVIRTGKYPTLCKMSKAILSCFHGPQIESSFSNMGDIIDSKSNRMNISTYSAIQTVRYSLKAKGKTAIQAYQRKDVLHDPVPPNLIRSMRCAYKRHKEILDDKQNKLDAKKRCLEVKPKTLTSKSEHKLSEKLAASKALKIHRQKILKKLVEKRSKQKKL